MDSFKLPMTFEIKKTDILRLLYWRIEAYNPGGLLFQGLECPCRSRRFQPIWRNHGESGI
jgi:hypothetical protein